MTHDVLPVSKNRIPAAAHTLVDPDVAKQYADWAWYLDGYGYVVNGKARCRLHRLVMNAPKGMVVDHINGNRLDNRRCNLRLATHAQNGRNKPGFDNSGSQFKGVHWDNRSKRWACQISALFDTEEEAAKAYDAIAKALYGEFAYLNFPPDEG